MNEIKGIVSGNEVDISKVAMIVNGVDKGWEVRRQNGDILWGADRTLIGTDTIQMKGYGLPLKSVHIEGNTQQTGTPTPDAPIMPEFVGARTANLFDKSSATIYKAYINDQGYWVLSDDSRSVKIPCSPNTKYTLSIPQSIAVFRIYETSDPSLLPSSQTVTNRLVRSQDRSQSTFTTGANAAAIIFQGSSSAVDTWFNGLMLNTGSTALPFEPFGWEIPITNAGQPVPVYLGQAQTVRSIRKLVLDGTEEWTYITGGKHWTSVTGYQKSGIMCLCTHYEAVENSSGSAFVTNGQVGFYSSTNDILMICDTSYTTTENWKSYLADQYAAGTPVTIWYVLAEPTTGVVNEPLCKIGDYADELHIGSEVTIPTVNGSNTITTDTTLPPSGIEITGHVKYLSNQ